MDTLRRPDTFLCTNSPARIGEPVAWSQAAAHAGADATVWVSCGSGFRAAVAGSLLARAGVPVVIVDDDFAKADDAGLHIVNDHHGATLGWPTATDVLFAAVLVGVALGFALGLFGGGGGILAVPLLLAIGIPADSAGTTSFGSGGRGCHVGVITNARVGRVAWREGLTFAALGIVAAMVGSKLALWAADGPQLLAFTLLMVIAGALMLRKALATPDEVEDASAPGATARRRASWPLVVAVAVGSVWSPASSASAGIPGGAGAHDRAGNADAPRHRHRAIGDRDQLSCGVGPTRRGGDGRPGDGDRHHRGCHHHLPGCPVVEPMECPGLGIGFAALVLAMSVLTAWEAWQLLAA